MAVAAAAAAAMVVVVGCGLRHACGGLPCKVASAGSAGGKGVGGAGIGWWRWLVSSPPREVCTAGTLHRPWLGVPCPALPCPPCLLQHTWLELPGGHTSPKKPHIQRPPCTHLQVVHERWDNDIFFAVCIQVCYEGCCVDRAGHFCHPLELHILRTSVFEKILLLTTISRHRSGTNLDLGPDWGIDQKLLNSFRNLHTTLTQTPPCQGPLHFEEIYFHLWRRVRR